MKIQPISSWQNGQEKQGTIFDLRIVSDNLSTFATFYYSISNEEISHIETKVISPATETEEETYYQQKVIDSYAQTLVEGNLTMTPEEYLEWDNSNEGAYNWAATKLNLTLIPNQIIA